MRGGGDEVFIELGFSLLSMQRFSVFTSPGPIFQIVHSLAGPVICLSIWLFLKSMEDEG